MHVTGFAHFWISGVTVWLALVAFDDDVGRSEGKELGKDDGVRVLVVVIVSSIPLKLTEELEELESELVAGRGETVRVDSSVVSTLEVGSVWPSVRVTVAVVVIVTVNVTGPPEDAERLVSVTTAVSTLEEMGVVIGVSLVTGSGSTVKVSTSVR